MAKFATGGFHGLRYVQESELGVTPNVPLMKALRHTSCSLQLSKDSFQSQELRSDGQISDLRHGTCQSGGDIGMEFSFGSFDDLLAAALRSIWKDDPETGYKYLIAGTDVPSFTIERAFTDIGKFEVFNGCQVSTLTLEVQTNAMVTGTIGIIGNGVVFAEQPLSETVEPAPTYEPFDGFTGELREAGIDISVITSITINLDNGIQPAFVLANKFAEDLVSGRINVTGTVSAYFKDLGLLKKFVDEEESSIQLILVDSRTKASYRITLPRIKYSGGSNSVEGEGGIVLDMPFQALYDQCTGTNIKVERIPPAVVPDCAITYNGTAFAESPTAPGTIETIISGTLSGGKNAKTFNGRAGSEIPGFRFTGLPAGLTGKALKSDNSKVTLSIEGTAASPIPTGQIGVEFDASAVAFGFCHCPNNDIAGRTANFDLTGLPPTGPTEPEGPQEPVQPQPTLSFATAIAEGALLTAIKALTSDATTEGALVASISRGMSVINDGGGARVTVFHDGMTRAPVFRTDGVDHCVRIMEWIENNRDNLSSIVETTTKHGKLTSVESFPAGRNLFTRFTYGTGDAMGMNMATIATEAICKEIESRTGAVMVSVSGNMCSDKKAAAINMIRGRGKSVIAEARIPKDIVESRLHASTDSIVETNTRKNLIGSSLSATLGANAHAANMIAALYIATGQDPAQVVSGSMTTTMCENMEGDLYISVRMPAVEVGTVGGGTRLPSQSEALAMIGCLGNEKAKKLAEIVAVTVLAGELSTVAAQAAGHLGKAHQELGR